MTDETSAPDAKGDSKNEKIVKEAKRRFARCSDWEGKARKRYIEDTKFANGDSDNLYQWPQNIRDARGWNTAKERPCLTVNKTRQHNLQIINDARQNKTAIKVKPVGDGASYEAAQVYEGIVRHIEYISDADSTYATATRHQVEGGIGYWRLVTDYADEDSFDQEIFIRRIKDPLSVYVDPDFREADGSDMRFAFVFDDMPREEFEAQYPNLKDSMPETSLGNDDGWISKDHVRVAEYFRRVENTKRLFVYDDPATGQQTKLPYHEIPAEMRKIIDEQMIDDPTSLKWRDVVSSKVEWFLIAGDRVIETREWLGRYIPIIRVPGEETVIDGELDRKGHTRALKDPQRMYNYNASAQVEFGALQTKIPYVAPIEAIEGYETYWSSANIENYAMLPYKAFDEKGNAIPAPQRSQPPVTAPAFQVGMENAANDMMLVSGQYQADMGAPSNEVTGVAIQQRQRRGENATYHYIDNLARAIRVTGKMIIDLIPKVYDTKRIIKILAEDGSDSDVMLDPQAAQAHAKVKAQMGEAAEQVVFNPTVGRYDVMADPGPAYATRRQEAFNAISQMIAQNQELAHIAGDLLFKVADFPGAEEIAERLRRMVPPAALGEGPPPALAQAQQQIDALKGLIMKLSEKVSDKTADYQNKAAAIGVDQYRALTERIDKLLAHTGVPASDLAQMDHDTFMAAHQSALRQQEQATGAMIQAATQPQQQPGQANG